MLMSAERNGVSRAGAIFGDDGDGRGDDGGRCTETFNDVGARCRTAAGLVGVSVGSSSEHASPSHLRSNQG